ncbi:MAG: S1-like domain-containing RNA-binding protein [Lachnospiraceae bacterium]|nr:S1-like domain-containing RNA-binding protein [Lachnospiraceae bacterium]
MREEGKHSGPFEGHDRKNTGRKVNENKRYENAPHWNDKPGNRNGRDDRKKTTYKSDITPGLYHDLEYTKKTDFGIYLKEPGKENGEEILLPKRYVPKDARLHDVLHVFVYQDSSDRPVATTEEPLITLGTIARLYVNEVTDIGAFLNWDMPKDLLLPFHEQLYPVQKDDAVLVALYTDKSGRLAATMHIYKYLKKDSPYREGDQVTGRVYENSEDHGAYIAVDDLYSALLPKKDMVKRLKINEPVHARVARVLEDGKLTLSLNKKIPEQMEIDADKLLRFLENKGGHMPYNDKSSPEDIRRVFGMSKSSFKRALGSLYKDRKIVIDETGVHLV